MKYTLEYWKSRKVKVLDKAPKGYIKRVGATTQPKGYVWYSNKVSMFSNQYKHVLVKEEGRKYDN